MKLTHLCLAVLLLVWSTAPSAQEPKPRLIEQPDAFKTLVNPMCSHCRDEAKRRAGDLRPDDRVLCWIRGYSEGGVIPYRFFLNPYRVISDTYGVFVYDPDAGYARGFAASLDFQFHGWKNGVMVMKHKDGTLYSCLSGIAFAGPKTGDKLKAAPTLVSDWGHWLDTYPQAVAYNMFDKYQPVELPTTTHPASLKSRVGAAKVTDEARMFGIAAGKEARLYPLDVLAKEGMLRDAIDGKPAVLLWFDKTKTAAAYRPIAAPPKNVKAEPRNLTLERDGKIATAPFRDKETGSHWDIAGRAVDGDLKGWTLEWLDGIEVKRFAWAAEYPHTMIYEQKKEFGEKPNAKGALKEIAGTSEFLRAVPKKFGMLFGVDATKNTVSIRFDGNNSTWPLTPDAEVKVDGYWGRLPDLFPRRKFGAPKGSELDETRRVWAWFKVNRANEPVAIFMLADSLSEQDIHGDGVTIQSMDALKIAYGTGKDKTREVLHFWCVRSIDGKRADVDDLKPKDRVFVRAFPTADGDQVEFMDRATLEIYRTKQKDKQRQRWLKEGLPGSIGFLHLYAGEVDVILDHEGMRWGRALSPGDKVEIISTTQVEVITPRLIKKVELMANPPIKAVVKSVTAQREKTQVRLVARSIDLADLHMGERVFLRMPAPSAEVENAAMPPGSDVPKSKEERIDWFLANTYCTCKIGGDGCTGHFYTLASCNPNACGAPNQTRRTIAAKIDDGWTNREIFQALLKERGQTMLRPHLLP